MTPKPYIREVSKTRWYLDMGHPRYKHYMAREVTCIFIFAYTFLLICALGSLAQRPEAFQEFMNSLRGAWGVLFNLVVLVVSVYHSMTWFSTMPQAMPIQRGEEFVPDNIILGASYGAWAVASLIILIWGI